MQKKGAAKMTKKKGSPSTVPASVVQDSAIPATDASTSAVSASNAPTSAISVSAVQAPAEQAPTVSTSDTSYAELEANAKATKMAHESANAALAVHYPTSQSKCTMMKAHV